MNLSSKWKDLLAAAVLAPSGHNTQPWQFVLLDDAIQIHPDRSRALPVVDPDDHALYISLGCAAENLMLAAAQYGYRADLSVREPAGEPAFLHIGLRPDPTVEKDALFDQIEKRQVTRKAYYDRPVPSEALEKLWSAARMPGIECFTYNSREVIRQLTPFIIEGSNRQFNNQNFVRELVSWIRFSMWESRRERDGVSYASMGMPGVGRFLGAIVMRYFVSPKSEARRWRKLIDTTPALVLFTVADNNVDHWIRLGRAFQRFGLTATQLDIRHAHLNMPCEEVEVRRQLAAHLQLKDHPLLLIRIGYGETMPPSFRRPVSAVVRTQQATAAAV